MKARILILLLVLLFVNGTISGQEKVDTINITKFKNALGFGAGLTTGYGLSYRFIPNKFGVQINFAPYKEEYLTWISFGITFLYKLIETKNTNLFLYQGNHYFYRKENFNYSYGYNYYPDSVDKYFNNGLGIGIEFIILKSLGFNLMGGYAFYDNFDKISFTGETGLYFKF